MVQEIKFPEIPLRITYTPDVIAHNMMLSDGRNVAFPALQSAGTITAAIIGGGPTLRDDIGDMTRLDKLDGESGYLKVLTGSAHRLADQEMLKNGAHITVINSHDVAFADVIAKAHQAMEYWFASFVAPEVFAKIPPQQVRLWDAYVPEIDYEGRQGPVIGSGSTAPSAAAALLIHLGVKRLEFFGVDGGSFDPSINKYETYDLSDVLAEIPQTDLDAHVLIEIGGNIMKVATNFWNQAEEMAYLIKQNPDVTFTFHGDSLNNMLFNRGLTFKIVSDPRSEPAPAPSVKGPAGP